MAIEVLDVIGTRTSGAFASITVPIHYPILAGDVMLIAYGSTNGTHRITGSGWSITDIDTLTGEAGHFFKTQYVLFSGVEPVLDHVSINYTAGSTTEWSCCGVILRGTTGVVGATGTNDVSDTNNTDNVSGGDITLVPANGMAIVMACQSGAAGDPVDTVLSSIDGADPRFYSPNWGSGDGLQSWTSGNGVSTVPMSTLIRTNREQTGTVNLPALVWSRAGVGHMMSGCRVAWDGAYVAPTYPARAGGGLLASL